jgi:hypothetical protein
VNLHLDEFLHEIDKYKHLDEDFFLDVRFENPIDIEFAKILVKKKKLFKELRNKLGSTEDENLDSYRINRITENGYQREIEIELRTKNLINFIKEDIIDIEWRFKFRSAYWHTLEKALIVNVNLDDSINSSDLSTQFKTNEIENHFKNSNYEVLWDEVEDLSDLSDKDIISNFVNGKMVEKLNLMVLNFEYRWYDYFHYDQENENLLEEFKKNIPRNWSVYQIIHTANYFYVRHYISPSGGSRTF